MPDDPGVIAQVPTQVGIGLIRRGNRFLVRVRPPGKPLAGFWEFPGGKCEPGETASEAAARECREELGLNVRIGSLRLSTTHGYAHGRVELYYFDGDLCNPSESPKLETGFRWVPVEELVCLEFPEANSPILADLGLKFGESREAPTG